MSAPESPNDDDGPTSEDVLARQHALSDRLRQIFDHVVEEAVPDDFMDLLAQLSDDPAPEAGPQHTEKKERP